MKKRTIENIARTIVLTIILLISAVEGILISMFETPIFAIIMVIAMIGMAIYTDVVTIRMLIEEGRYEEEA